jgi:hypothetical protein
VTPTAKTAKRHRYSPSVVSTTTRPSSSRRVPVQLHSYRTVTPARSTNATSAASISARDGTSKVRSMKSGASPLTDGSSPTRLLWSYHSYSRDWRLTGASGFVQLISRSKIGNRRNIPPGVSSRESTACPTPSDDSV